MLYFVYKLRDLNFKIIIIKYEKLININIDYDNGKFLFKQMNFNLSETLPSCSVVEDSVND